SGEIESRLKALATSLSLEVHDARSVPLSPGVRAPIHFTGALPESEKDALLREAHFLLHTSVREGWGLNVIEANAMGTPAAVYPVGGLVDSTVPGKTGIVTPAETPESLADALADIVKKPELYSQYRSNAWERSKTFSWPAI